MASITRVTLLRNTVNDINTATSIDITSEFLGSVTPTIDASAIAYQGANVTRSGLTPGTTYWMWLEVEDGAGNVTVQVLGSIETAAPVPTRIVPTLSSPTSDGCVATWSSQWRVGQEGWRVFDRTNNADTGGWAAQRDAPFPHWTAIELPEPKRAVRFRLWNVDVWANFRIKTFEIQGRNGEDPWDVLGEYTNVSYTTITPSEKQTHPQYQEDILSSDSGNAYMFEANLTSTGAYKHYRIITKTLDTGGLTVTLGEWVLLGYE